MNELSCDVLVVGAGPVGSFTARKIAEKGYKVILAEEHEKIGEPAHCTGLVTPRVLEIAGIGREVIQSEIYGADIHSPDGTILPVRGKRIEAFSIDRIAFDRTLCEMAANAGAEILTGTRISDCIRKNGKVSATAKPGEEKRDITAKLVIGADGAFSAVRRSAMIREPTELLYGYQAEFEGVELDESKVDVFLGNGIAPGFFAWVVPAGKGKARAGLCTTSQKPTAGQYFESFVSRPEVRQLLKDGKISRKMAGVVSLGAPKKTHSNNLMIVGDAAAQVKPTSGGGLYTGLVSSAECAKTAIEALKADNFTENFLARYNMRWRQEIGKELAIGGYFRTGFRGMRDSTMNKIFEKLNDQETLEIISEYGDIDYPSKVGKEVLKKKPGLVWQAPLVLWDILGSRL
ncbi:MAG: NAD(P)/FAD-dependent oxidoreductase [Candidatus Thermoplasmatota archaeon]|nr:NAD(P)/FAD-dependent oxidoreductase [Candidatus Thermoplasmatota archaeon]